MYCSPKRLCLTRVFHHFSSILLHIGRYADLFESQQTDYSRPLRVHQSIDECLNVDLILRRVKGSFIEVPKKEASYHVTS